MKAEELNELYKGKHDLPLECLDRIPSKEEYLRRIYSRGVYSTEELSAMMDEVIERCCSESWPEGPHDPSASDTKSGT